MMNGCLITDKAFLTKKKTKNTSLCEHSGIFLPENIEFDA